MARWRKRDRQIKYKSEDGKERKLSDAQRLRESVQKRRWIGIDMHRQRGCVCEMLGFIYWSLKRERE